MKIIRNCKVCSMKLKGKQTMFCSIFCKNKLHQSYPSQKRRSISRKLELAKLAGGKCSLCGYNKNLSSLAFHHREAKDKSFKLDARVLSNRTWDSIMDEFKKCILVCHNCHHEIHNPHLDLGLPELSRLL